MCALKFNGLKVSVRESCDLMQFFYPFFKFFLLFILFAAFTFFVFKHICYVCILHCAFGISMHIINMYDLLCCLFVFHLHLNVFFQVCVLLIIIIIIVFKSFFRYVFYCFSTVFFFIFFCSSISSSSWASDNIICITLCYAAHVFWMENCIARLCDSADSFFFVCNVESNSHSWNRTEKYI